MTVETLKHSDVRGNVLNYIRIKNAKGTEYLINVGEKTVKEVDKLVEEEKAYRLSAAGQLNQQTRENREVK